VFAGLGHDALISGDHQHDKVHAADAGHHGTDELFVTRHIHDPELDAPRQFQMGKAQLDGDAAGLLLLESIGIDASQGLDQRGLAVVNMSGRAEDQVFHALTPCG